MIDHIYPSKIAETIADAVHAMERIADTQVNTWCEKQTITRMDFALECDRSTLDDILSYLKIMYGIVPAMAVGVNSHIIHIAIDSAK